MRLSKPKIENLTSSIHSFLPKSKVYLFGSRVDDTKKGGDIDILILGDRKLTFIEKSKIEKNFFMSYGEQKLDLLSLPFKSNNPFKNLVLEEAVEL